MKLPTIDTPIYEVKLFSREEPVKFRPFLVKEQKLMLMVMEERNPEEATKITKQIIKSCLQDQTIDVDSLPAVDIEILFLNFRARSMGENIDVYFKCKNMFKFDEEEEEKECGMVLDFTVNLLEVPVVNEDYDSKIMLSDTIGVKMKLPNFDIVKQIASENSVENSEFKSIALCIDYIFDKDNVYYAKDATIEELVDFLLQLSADKYELITKYFNNIPTVRQVLHKECPKCRFKHNFVLEGLKDFFS